MYRERIDLNSFKREAGFYGELELLATVKNFDLQAIRARYLASKKNKNSRTGSVERRAPALGGILSFSLSEGKIQHQSTLTELKEPRGIASKGELLAFSSENKVYLIEGDEIRLIEDPWFSYIHTVDFNSAADRLLVSSSGFDLILEYDLTSLERSAEWWAWENGFDKGLDPKTGEQVTLSRKEIAGTGPVRLIQDPLKDSLPTAMRAAFINSVEYDQANEGAYIATFFHEGKVFRIDTYSGKAEAIIQDLKNPHGGTSWGNVSMATSTRTGEVILQEGDQERSFSFGQLPGKPEELGNEEWIQNSKRLADGSIISIDSNRCSWVIFHPEKELIDIIPYPDNLAVQDLVICEKGSERWEEGIRSI